MLFFAGHIPLLYLSRLRFVIWQQLYSDPRATVISRNLDANLAEALACNASTNGTGTSSRFRSLVREKMKRACRAYRQVGFVAEYRRAQLLGRHVVARSWFQVAGCC